MSSAALGIVLVAGVGVAAKAGLAGVTDATDRLNQIAVAESLVRDADVANDALHAAILASALGQRGVPFGGAQAPGQDLGNDLVETLDAAVAVPIPSRLRDAVGRAQPLLHEYVSRADRLLGAQRLDAAQLTVFEQSYRRTEEALVELIRTFAAAKGAAIADGRAAGTEANRLIVIGSSVAALVLLALGSLLGRSIVGALASLGAVASRVAGGDLQARNEVSGSDEIATVAGGLDLMADHLVDLVGRLEAEAEQTQFSRDLGTALDMAVDELAVHGVVARAMQEAGDPTPMELLLADSSRAHLERVVTHPQAGAPGCDVASPFDCPAVRRAQATTFPSSGALNACPHLRDRASGPCSALCVPVSFMGRSLGVLHATGPDGRPPEAALARLVVVAEQAGQRIGTLRAFSRTQLQASTDPLTGALNRRSLEVELRSLVEADGPFAVAIADLDHFKDLNDTHGHEVGDRALRHFTGLLRSSLRAQDLVARLGGEEFALVLPGVDAETALPLLDRIRASLAASLEGGSLPAFTVSIGVADNAGGQDADGVLRAADVALYEAKAAGRDAVVGGHVVNGLIPREEAVAARRAVHDASPEGFRELGRNGD